MTTEADLIAALVDAHRNGTHTVDPAPYSALDRAGAYRVQHGVMTGLGETPGLYKTAVAPDGLGIVAPIYASRLSQAGEVQFPEANVVGLEVEVAVVLGKPMTAEMDDAALLDAIDHYVMGVEIVGTRYTDRDAASATGGLADAMSALGYVVHTEWRPAGADLDGVEVSLEFAGRSIWAAPTKHSFGGVRNSLMAYARNQMPAYPLPAGMLVTTGSVCGLVKTSGTGRVVARLGDQTITFDIV
jgi:2-keto-4-pentenoate hydratase